MQYSRARIAITVGEGPLHIGHARALVLGQLIARELDCPFHVRVDNIPPPWGDCKKDEVRFCLAIHELLRFLGIDCLLYGHAQSVLDAASVAELTGLDAEVVVAYQRVTGNIGRERTLPIQDDAILHHPSLIMRGEEFISPGAWLPPPAANSMSAQINAEDGAFAALGREKLELNFPLVLLDSGKMSKSQNGITWEALTMASGKDVRRFLLATALRPLDPLGALDTEFAVDAIADQSYQWRWDTWARFLAHLRE